MNNSHNKKLVGNSRNLRKNMTKEERHLWYDCLQLLPVTVRRQKVFGNYIVDFYCASAKLVIELDGSQHYDQQGMEYDAVRDAYLKDLGLEIVRYTNLDIQRNFDGVCQDIMRRLKLP